MTVTTLAEVQAVVQEYWAPFFTNRLREVTLLSNLVNKDYKGSIQNMGDTVTVSQVVDPTGELRTIGVDADVFSTEQASILDVQVTANKRAVQAYEFNDLVELQSKLQRKDVQDGMVNAIERQINNYLYSLVAPSTSAPDHELGYSSLGLAEFAAISRLASEAKWPYQGQRYALISPQYWEGIESNTTFDSRDYVGDVLPVVNGQKARIISGSILIQ